MWAILAVLAVLGILYAHRMNKLMLSVSPEALAHAPNRWTDEEIRAASLQHSKSPVDIKPHLPPKTGNRYIVVGGNGFVGGWIVLHLLERGEDPGNIRILDIRAPIRRDLKTGRAAKVEFIKVDITNLEEVNKAFHYPWPSNSTAPLTVFHTAAVIRFFERSSSLEHLSNKVNVIGTRNVLTAASQAGASYFIFTSSGSIHNQKVNYFVAPWKTQPGNFFQVVAESSPIPTGNDCISNYTRSKANADSIVRSRNGNGNHNHNGSMRTGTLRPGSMIYGPGGDPAISNYLKNGTTPTWIQNSLQMHVYVENVSLAHLLFEQRLMEDQATNQDRFGGRSFVISDGCACAFGDIYRFLNINTNGKTQFPLVSPFPMLLLAYVIEFYHITHYRLVTIAPFLKSIIPPLGSDIVNLQPSMFNTSSSHIIFDDSPARGSPNDGGLGFKPPFTTLMGLARTVERHVAELNGFESVDLHEKSDISHAEHAVGELGNKFGVLNS